MKTKIKLSCTKGTSLDSLNIYRSGEDNTAIDPITCRKGNTMGELLCGKPWDKGCAINYALSYDDPVGLIIDERIAVFEPNERVEEQVIFVEHVKISGVQK